MSIALSAPPTNPTPHNSKCTKAKNPQCACSCYGMLHQTDILTDVLLCCPRTMKPATIDHKLTLLFGGAHNNLTSPPTSSCPARRKWQSSTAPGTLTGRNASQIEQRIVDTTLRDILKHIFCIPCPSKKRWHDFYLDITGRSSSTSSGVTPSLWSSLARQLRTNTPTMSRESSYFWPSLLALHMSQAGPSRPAKIFNTAAYPRGRSGNSIKAINEMRNRNSVTMSFSVISNARTSYTGIISQKHMNIVQCAVACSISPDLWRNPATVKHCLLPVITDLRNHSGFSFSLDLHKRFSVEFFIDVHLANKWKCGGLW